MSYDDLINFKSERERDEWCSGNLNPTLSAVFLDVARFSRAMKFLQPVVTSIYRSPEEDELLEGHGVHPVWRAIDIHAPAWGDASISTIAAYVNNKWIYDRSRPNLKVALFEPHGNAPHCHFQVHANTEAR